MIEVFVGFLLGLFAGFFFTWQHYDHKQARREHRLFMAQSKERVMRLLSQGTSFRLVTTEEEHANIKKKHWA